MHKVEMYCTEASAYFARKLADQLGIHLDGIESRQFGGGERYYRLPLTERGELMGKDVILVGSTHTDESIEEMYRVGCALAAYGTRRRIFVIPFFGYSTMERAQKPGEVVTAKTIARQLSTIPNTGMGNVFLFMDLHVSGIVHYFEGDCLRFELYSEPAILAELGKLIPNLGRDKNIIFGSADLGRPMWVRSFSKKFGTRMVLIDKGREGETTRVNDVIGDVQDATVVIYDDMLRSGGTLVNAAYAYLAHGAKNVFAITSHASLNNDGVVDLIASSHIEKVLVTNTHPMSQNPKLRACKKFITADVTPIFTNEIKKLID